MLENIFQYSILSFVLITVLLLLVLVKTQLKLWQVWLLATALAYPSAVIAGHLGAQIVLVMLLLLGIFIVPRIRLSIFTSPCLMLCERRYHQSV